MHKFIRWYNQNRAVFFIGVALIAFFFILIQIMNGIIKAEDEKKQNQISYRNSIINKNTTISKADQSVITGQKIPEQTSNSNKRIIKQFVDYCNQEEVEEAYSMLSDECKEVMYPTIEDFTKNYFLRVFNVNRTYNLENWYANGSSYTYYIKYSEDLLATGNTNSNNNINDYITVIRTDSGYKLNISSYIGRIINGEYTNNNNITLTVNWIDYYVDNCVLNITVSNNTADNICLDTLESVNSVYIYDVNNVIHTAYMNGFYDEELMIKKGESLTINITFGNSYNPDNVISGVVFRDVVLNYDKYTNGMEKKDRITLHT